MLTFNFDFQIAIDLCPNFQKPPLPPPKIPGYAPKISYLIKSPSNLREEKNEIDGKYIERQKFYLFCLMLKHI